MNLQGLLVEDILLSSSNFKDILKYSPLFSIIGVLMVFVIPRINNWGNTTLEMKLNSNWEKVKDIIFLFLIFANLFAVLFWIIFLGKEHFIVCFILGFMYFLLIFCMSFLLSLFSEKDKYFIKLKGNNEEELWEIIRYSGKKEGYLLKREVILKNKKTICYKFQKDVFEETFILDKVQAKIPLKEWISKIKFDILRNS